MRAHQFFGGCLGIAAEEERLDFLIPRGIDDGFVRQHRIRLQKRGAEQECNNGAEAKHTFDIALYAPLYSAPRQPAAAARNKVDR